MVHVLHGLLRGLVFAILLSGFLIPCQLVHAQAAPSPDIPKGLAWLQAQVQSDGHLSGEAGSAAAPLQARGETLQTLKLLASVPPTLTAAIAADTPVNTELLARQSLALAIAGQSMEAITSDLVCQISP